MVNRKLAPYSVAKTTWGQWCVMEWEGTRLRDCTYRDDWVSAIGVACGEEHSAGVR